MKVKDVIRMLQEYDPEANLFMQNNFGDPYEPREEWFIQPARRVLTPTGLEALNLSGDEVFIIGHHVVKWERAHKRGLADE